MMMLDNVIHQMNTNKTTHKSDFLLKKPIHSGRFFWVEKIIYPQKIAQIKENRDSLNFATLEDEFVKNAESL